MQEDNARSHDDETERVPQLSLDGCMRILVVGRTGSGKTTLAAELAARIGFNHIELDALYFGPRFTTVSPEELRQRTSEAIAQETWIADGNKSSVRDLVWPRVDTIIWLDYPLAVSLWRLGRRGRSTMASLQSAAAATGTRRSLPSQVKAGAKGVARALKSHRGQRKEYPTLFALPENAHIAVVRLRSPRSTQFWLDTVTSPGKLS